MIINNDNSINLNAKQARGKTPTPANGSEPQANSTPASRSGEQVVLSQEAQSASRLQANMGNIPDVNLERVAQLRQAISEGRFEINPERIAENLINQEQLLG